ncbi:MAG: Nif3-like dinuclear metal center hexameric protein [Acidimicrobiia bacterium]|jgi:dinuclear metal center YbgI/SA1388 family protein
MPVPTIAEVLGGLDAAIDPSRAAGWDAGGLQVGDAEAPVRRLGVCHEVTDKVVAAAEADPPDLLVVYHPLIFRALTGVRAGPGSEGRVFRLLRAGVAVAVVHTAFDAAPGGAADALAAAVGLTDSVPFGPIHPAGQVKVVTFVPAEVVEEVAATMAAAGAGRIGAYTGCSFRSEGTGAFEAPAGASPVTGSAGAVNREPEVRLEMIAPAGREGAVVAALVRAHPYEEPAFDVYEVRSNLGFGGRVGSLASPTSLSRFGAQVGSVLGDTGLRVSGAEDREIVRVAVIPGSGSSMLADAAATGADVFVTGDVAHHRAIEALDRGIALVDPGHAATERPGLARLRELAGMLGPEVVDLVHHDPTPWWRPVAR